MEKQSEQTKPQQQQQKESKKEWGYDLYPERKGAPENPSVTNIVFGGGGTEEYDKIKCERNVYRCIKESPMVKLMMGALKSSGCKIDIRRHIACERCDTTVSGGYDPEMNQIIVCQNVATSAGLVQGVLTHEMIHMFDYCRNDLDFKNIEHLACTEIRAANLTHCSFTSAWMQGDCSPLDFKQKHQDCVKTKALQSIMAVRDIKMTDAVDVVEKVFPKCYADLEPIGRRLRRKTKDMYRAYDESFFYGYT